MSDFFAWFRTKYGSEFPVALSRPLQTLDRHVWITGELAGHLEHPPMIPEFYDQPAEYAITGEWGRGVNSYAFYFVEKRSAHRRFFRIFSGGVYGRPEEDQRAVVDYLAGYEAWRLQFESRFSASTLICNMGESTAELVDATGATISHTGVAEGREWWEELQQRT